jgi:hypothetical protein
MTAPWSVFLEFNLPNATTWFYFSLLLAVALFFKFARLLSIRNWDIVTLFLLVPGLLVVQGARPQPAPAPQLPTVAIAGLAGQAAMPGGATGTFAQLGVFGQRCAPVLEARRWLWFGYLWLLLGSVYFFCRCLLDLILVQRPALPPNLNFGGLAWLAGALMVCLIAVAFRQAERPVLLPNHAADILPSAAAKSGPEPAWLVLADDWLAPPPWVASLAAVVCHIAVVLGLMVLGSRVFQDASAGMAAATFYLMLPYTGLYVGQLRHALPMALLVWAVAAYRWPTLLGTLLGLATAITYFPVVALPIWLSFYRGRGAGRFLCAFVLTLGLCLAALAWALSGQGGLEPLLRETFAQTAWQPWLVPSTEGFWTGIHWAYRIPVFIAYIAFVLGTLFWPVPKNLAQALALTTAALIGVQFWYADQGGVYVLWYLPLLLLLVFRPNLHDRLAWPIVSDTDWLAQSARQLWRGLRWLVRMPEPPAKARSE